MSLKNGAASMEVCSSLMEKAVTEAATTTPPSNDKARRRYMQKYRELDCPRSSSSQLLLEFPASFVLFRLALFLARRDMMSRMT